MKKVMLVDYGSYYFKDVVFCFDSLNVQYIKTSYDKIPNKINETDLCGIILTGSPKSVNDSDSPRLDSRLLKWKLPILGICYGMQLLMDSMGGKVEALNKRDYGYSEMTTIIQSPLNCGISNPTKVWMAHYDHVTKLAEGFEFYASTPISIAMVGNEKQKIYGIQYHPEAKKSDDDMQLLKNFVYDICRYDME